MNQEKCKNFKYMSICFVAGLVLILLLCVFFGDKKFSETENRVLTQLPKFDAESILDGDYTKNFEKYAADAIVFRDFWVKFKNTADFVSLKKDNGYAYFGKKDDLFLIETTNEELLKKNIAAVQGLAKNTDLKVTALIAPTANLVLKENLPKDAESFQNYKQADIFASLLEELGDTFVDVRKSLEKHSGEYIYYKTDHHWTSLGAYYAYVELAKHLGFEPITQDRFQKRVLSTEFRGSIEAKIPTFFSPKDEIWAYENAEILAADAKFEDGKQAKIFDESFLAKRDKYSYFLGGNHPLIELERKIDEREKIGETKSVLLIKDSYANCLAPLLLEHYQKVYLVDLRYYRQSIKTLITDIQYSDNVRLSDIVVLYNAPQFSTDVNAALMAR